MWRKYNRREGGRGRVDERVTVSVRKRERETEDVFAQCTRVERQASVAVRE